MKNFAAFLHDERHKRERRDGIGPRRVKDGVGQQSGQRNQRQLATKSRLGSVSAQRSARKLRGELALLTCQPGHARRGNSQHHNADDAWPRLAMAEKRKSGSDDDEGREQEEQSPGEASGKFFGLG